MEPRQIAWLFPGQGSQAVGMGKDLLEASAAARDVFARADAALGDSPPLSRLILEGPEEELTLTANAQPALVTMSAAVLAAMRERYPSLPAPRFAAGHSLGEYSALVAADALSLEDAVRLVRARGLAMQAAVPEGEGSMAAIIGIDAERIEEICREVIAELGETVSCANFNCPGQVVIAGRARAVSRVSERVRERPTSEDGPPPSRRSSIPLRVSAPFHCVLMAPAADVIRAELQAIEIRPLAFPIVANFDALPNSDPERAKELLVHQVASAVRWEQAVTFMHSAGVTHAIEIGAGKALAGMCKRTAKAMRVLSVSDLAGLEAIAAFLESPAPEPAP